MKQIQKIATLVLVLCCTGLVPGLAIALNATSTEVALVYRGNTPINRDTINFIRKKASLFGAAYTYRFFTDPGQVVPDSYRAVVLISTGMVNGIDPAFERYIQSSTAKNKIIVVSLLAGSTNYTVSLAKNLGVDTVTAASAWAEGRGGRGRNAGTGAGSGAGIMQMHQDWVRQLVTLIGSR